MNWNIASDSLSTRLRQADLLETMMRLLAVCKCFYNCFFKAFYVLHVPNICMLGEGILLEASIPTRGPKKSTFFNTYYLEFYLEYIKFEKVCASFSLTAISFCSNTNRPLLNFCSELLSNRDRKIAVVCSYCGFSIKVFTPKGTKNTQVAINHAYYHLGKTLFSCHHCDYKTASKNAIEKHIISVHSLRGTKDNYNNLLPSAIDELKIILERCFSSNAGSKQETSSQFDMINQKR